MEEYQPKPESLKFPVGMTSDAVQHYRTLRNDVFQYFLHNGLQVPERVKRAFTSYELSQEEVTKNEQVTLKDVKDFSKRKFQGIKEFLAYLFDLSSSVQQASNGNYLKNSLNQSNKILQQSSSSDSDKADVSFSYDHSSNKQKFRNSSSFHNNGPNSVCCVRTEKYDSSQNSDQILNHSKQKFTPSLSSHNNKPKATNVIIIKNSDPSYSSQHRSTREYTDTSSSKQNFVRNENCDLNSVPDVNHSKLNLNDSSKLSFNDSKQLRIDDCTNPKHINSKKMKNTNREQLKNKAVNCTSHIETTRSSSDSECKKSYGFTPYQEKVINSFVSTGFTKKMAKNLVQSIGENRRCLVHYKTHWDRWYNWCQGNSVHHFMFSPEQLLCFLKEMKDGGRSAVTIRGKLSGLTFVFKRTIGPQAKLKHPIIKAYLSSINK